MNTPQRTAIFAAAVLTAIALPMNRASAQQATSESASPTTHPAPLLEQMNRETQALFASVRPSLVHVQLPMPRWSNQLGDEDNPMNRWNLDPNVRAALEAQRAKMSGGLVQVHIVPSTRPATQTMDPTSRPIFPTMIVQRPDGGLELITPNAAPYDAMVGPPAAPRSLGIVYDDQGHIVIPMYIEKEAFDEEHPLAVMSAVEGKRGVSKASFVASDRQTDLTVLKLDAPLGAAAPFVGKRPQDGSLVMLLAQSGDSGRLAVWTRAQQERALLVDLNGQVLGFARPGLFLDADVAKPVIDQLIQYGKVRRAALGVMITEAEAPDGRHAMRVARVRKDSAAEAAGVQVGDFILSLAGQPVGDVPNFAAAISMRDGATPMEILRGEQTLQIQVELHAK